MATVNYTIPIYTITGGVPTPVETGSYYLRLDPFSSNTYTGTHVGDGVWSFGAVNDGYYQLWNATAQLSKWGTKWIGDSTPTLGNTTVNGTALFSGVTTFQGDGNTDNVVFDNCQVQFHANTSVNFNYGDIAHIDHTQTNTIGESYGGQGVTFTHQPKWNGTPTNNEDLVNKAFIDDLDTQFIPINGSATQVYTPVNFRSIVAFTPTSGYAFPPVCNVAPTYNGHITNKGYVDSEITTRISSMASGNYQESPNVIRLIPNGTPLTAQVYTTWNTALSYAAPIASSTRQMTILISGEGTSASNIQMGQYNSSYIADYVHFRGLGSDVVILTDGNIYGFDAGALGRTVIEDLTFYFDDVDGQNSGGFTNIVFKNCKFYGITSSQTFTGCQFLGNNYFDVDASLSFVNCIGNRITSARTNTTVSGTNKINIDYPTKITIGQCSLSDDGTTLTNNHALKTGNITLDTATIVDHGGHIYITPPTGGILDVAGGISSTGLNVVGNAQITGTFQISKRTINNQNDSGKEGEMCFDEQYLYLCIDNDTWARINHNGAW